MTKPTTPRYEMVRDPGDRQRWWYFGEAHAKRCLASFNEQGPNGVLGDGYAPAPLALGDGEEPWAIVECAPPQPAASTGEAVDVDAVRSDWRLLTKWNFGIHHHEAAERLANSIPALLTEAESLRTASAAKDARIVELKRRESALVAGLEEANRAVGQMRLALDARDPERGHAIVAAITYAMNAAERWRALAHPDGAARGYPEALAILALRNCLALARAKMKRPERAGSWDDIVRFCASAGIEPTILRDDDGATPAVDLRAATTKEG